MNQEHSHTLDGNSDIATEYTFSLELMDDAAGTKSLVVTSVKNIMDPSKSSCTVDEALLRPWLDALLGACGLLFFSSLTTSLMASLLVFDAHKTHKTQVLSPRQITGPRSATNASCAALIRVSTTEERHDPQTTRHTHETKTLAFSPQH